MKRHLRATLVVASACFAAWACGSDPDVGDTPEPEASGGMPDEATGGTRMMPSSGGIVNVGKGGTPDDGGRPPVDDPCLACGRGQRCDRSGVEPECVDNECANLDCGDVEECQPAPGGGNYCVNIACQASTDCPEARYCNAGRCVDDACEADTRRCQDEEILLCASDGSGEAAAYVCQGSGHLTSQCLDTGASGPGCSCEGDWDCPEFTACETNVCTGTGSVSGCTLPTLPFGDILPAMEFRWGGQNVDNPLVVGSPFQWSSQVESTPIVINLDDDTGDGLVNELDFPEILFISNHEDRPGEDGIVRAIHGGGANRGRDYFALCGPTHWLEGEPLTDDCNPDAGDAESRSEALARTGGLLAAADLDYDGVPEIVVPIEGGGFQLLDNRGNVILTSALGLWESGNFWKHPAPSLANLDFQGPAEVVVGNTVVTFLETASGLAIDHVFSRKNAVGTKGSTGTQDFGTLDRNFGPMVCVADLTPAAGLEFVAGTTAYRLPDVVDCSVPANAETDYCSERLTLVWDAGIVNADILGVEQREGLCAIADVLGADTVAAPGPDNPLDGKPEVVVIAEGHLVILDSATGDLLRLVSLGGGEGGGAPNVDDFDGDGFPEIATALANFYELIDLQDPSEPSCPEWLELLDGRGDPPGDNPSRTPGAGCTVDDDCNLGAVCNSTIGRCVCLHNGWKRDTEDDSSRATSSSMFDFNGDGATEVLYHDECYFRIYDGASGKVHLALPSVSRTLIETPVVVDVDNDGNAEIVFAENNFVQQCEEGNSPAGTQPWSSNDRLDSWPDGDDDVPKAALPSGIQVWGDPMDLWIPTRRVWNENSYHVTNVTEGGGLPLHEPESWLSHNGRLYNSYRSQPRSANLAPDLTITALQVSSPGGMCGELSDEIDIVVRVKNAGDLRIGPDVRVQIVGLWQDPDAEQVLLGIDGLPLEAPIGKPLPPGASTLITFTYFAGSNGRDDLPVEIRAVVDPPVDDSDGAERECNEDNNTLTRPVEPSEELPDLRIEIDSAGGCQPPIVRVVVTNDGATAALDVLVRVYISDPSSGAPPLGETVIPGPIEPGQSVTVDVELGALDRDVTVWAAADPLGAIPECNDANNVAEGPRVLCEEDIP